MEERIRDFEGTGLSLFIPRFFTLFYIEQKTIPYHLKSLGSYVYIKELKPGDTIDGEPIDEADKGVLTFDDENGKNKKAVLEFVSGSDYTVPNVKELNTGWYIQFKWQNGRNVLTEHPSGSLGMMHAEDEGAGVIRSYGTMWWSDDDEYVYLLPTGNPWGNGSNSIESGACERKGIVRLVSNKDWRFTRCMEEMGMDWWEFEETKDPNDSNSFYWNWINFNDDSKPFFHMNNGAIYVYGGGLILLIILFVVMMQEGDGSSPLLSL